MIPISKPYIGEEEKKAVLEVMDSGMLVQGPKVAQLEAEFTKKFGVKHAIAVSSGTTALHLSLLAHGIGAGDEVITPSFTFISSATSILFTGAQPVFVDIEEETYNIDPEKIRAAITPKTKAILVVHLYGYICDMDKIHSIAKEHDLAVIEDACQAIGAQYNNKYAGTFGTGCFSLYATKNIMSGEGGIILTSDDKIADTCKLMRAHGMRKRYYHEMLGYNFRMTDLCAAIGIVQFGRLDDFNQKREKNAQYYNEHIRSVITPKVRAGHKHCWHQYTVRTLKNRDEVVEQLTKAGIGTGVFYPVPAHQQQFIVEMFGETKLPVTELLAKQVFSLPIHPGLSQKDLEKVVAEVNKI